MKNANFRLPTYLNRRAFVASTAAALSGVLAAPMALTLNVCDTAELTGPFTLTGPEGVTIEDITRQPGEHWVRTIPFATATAKPPCAYKETWPSKPSSTSRKISSPTALSGP